MTASVTSSATLAVGESLEQLRRRGVDVISMASGEIRLPVLPQLADVVRASVERNEYGPVAGIDSYRAAAAGYWQRRGIDAAADRIVAGPGSKALLFAALVAIGGDVIVPRPSWVSYAAQAHLAKIGVIDVDTSPGGGGLPDPDAAANAIDAARRSGRDVRAIIVTLPDNPTGTIASTDHVRALADLARRYDLVIVSDEIYYDLTYDPHDVRGVSPVNFAPERTIVTTGLTKNLAVGGWRTGFALLPDRSELVDSVRAVASHIWSSPPMPIQHAAAYALEEPPEVTAWMESALSLHSSVTRAAASILQRGNLNLPTPRATCYLYPDFSAHREILAAYHDVHNSDHLAEILLHRFGIAALPGSAFGQHRHTLTIRLSTSQLYGTTEDEQRQALSAPEPTALPWIDRDLHRLHDAITSLVRRS